MSDETRDEFYVGYLPEVPSGLGRFVRRAVALVVVATAALAGLLAWLQEPFDRGRFEFGIERSFVGLLLEKPYPLLLAPAGEGGAAGAAETLLLTGPGKHGASVAGLDGRAVELRGSLVTGEDRKLLSLVRGAATEASVPTAAASEPRALGRISLIGEIVDSKCYLGVMKPGRGRPHRGCAERCLAGGIAPLFLVETQAGERRTLLLVDPSGRRLGDRLHGLVAEPIAVEGALERRGDLLVLAADPASFRLAGR
jgi:hypothetical protein